MTRAVAVVVRTRTEAGGSAGDQEILAELAAATSRPVRAVPPRDRHRVQDAGTVLSLAADFDPASAPDGALRVAWVHDEPNRWAANGYLDGYDVVLAGSGVGDIAAVTVRPVVRVAPGSEGAAQVVAQMDAPVPSPRPARALHFFPDYRVGNPYQAMLHAALDEVDAYAVPVRHAVDHLRRRTERPGDPGVLCVHWTVPILARATGPFRARLMLDRFARHLDAFTAAGGRLVWTVHNVLPHDARHRWAELELCRLLAERADLVHLLSPSTLEAVADLYRLDPAKVVVIEHASYLGCYPDSVSRAEARRQLGVDQDATALVTLGNVRPYKGIDLLLDAFAGPALADPGLRLLVAGRVLGEDGAEDLRRRCAGDPRVLSRFAHVPDEEVQLWLRAADVAVLPYRDVLNSGVFLLAQTFGLPVVGPRVGALLEHDGQPHVELFTPGDSTALGSAVATMVDRVRRDPVGPAALARAAAEAASPRAMAEAFAAAVAPLLQR